MLNDPNLPESDYELLDLASARFLHHIKLHYTRDVAVDVMNALQPILGKEWSGRLLFNLLADNYPNAGKIQIRVSHLSYKKIQAIKTVRALSGMTLTEAKKLVEDAETSPQYFEVVRDEYLSHRDSRRIENGMNELRDAGLLVDFL